MHRRGTVNNNAAGSSRPSERRGGVASAPSSFDLDFELALRLQIQEDLRDDYPLPSDTPALQDWTRRPHWQVPEVIPDAEVTFTCGICMDEHPEHSIARVDRCSHSMCRDCLKNHVVSKIKERQYPILCPICMANEATRAPPAEISRFLVELLGVTEEQFEILTGMELAQFTVQVLCRKCKRHGFIDRQDFTEHSEITCPHSGCNHVWCRKCDQTIRRNGPLHSCDGSSELKQLMKKRGWKACPQCTTPIQKVSGCDHMTCIAPGCNTHFCYLCGEMIARAPSSQRLGVELTAHGNTCRGSGPPDPPEVHGFPIRPLPIPDPLPVEPATAPAPNAEWYPPGAQTIHYPEHGLTAVFIPGNAAVPQNQYQPGWQWCHHLDQWLPV